MIIACIMLFSVNSSFLFAEAVFTKDGSIVEGKILRESRPSVQIKLSDGKVKDVPRSEILRILYHDNYKNKRYMTKMDGTVIEVYIVDEDKTSYTYRMNIDSPEEIKILKDDVDSISRRKVVSEGEVTALYSFPSGVSFMMKDALVPRGGVTFPSGQEDSEIGKVTGGFLIAETETTYELWSEVRAWAVKNGYTFDSKGDIGGSGTVFVTENGGSVKQPVTNISWNDAIVWCNALTEYCNANKLTSATLTCAYLTGGVIVRNAKNCVLCDGAIPSETAKGFRLPTPEEWEYAERYRGSDGTNAILRDNLYWTRGDSASGAERSDKSGADKFAVKGKHTSDVKSKSPNALGIYDMSGNAAEWCDRKKYENLIPKANQINNVDKTMYISAYAVSSYTDFKPVLFSTERLNLSHSNIGFRIARNK
jgi:formylglycine-generating enzyme required for sulfatase activity